MRAAVVSLVLCVAWAAGAEEGLNRKGKQWVPVEWSLENPTCEGNPFDLVARATFKHESGEETRVTEMFYAGGDTWKFRFTGTQPGKWTFATAGADPDLAGKSGTVALAPNPSSNGFVVAEGDKWVWSGTGRAFVPQLVMYASPEFYHDKPEKIDRDIQTFLVEHGFTGFHTQVYCRWFDINEDRTTGLDDKDPNPDFRTFEALELLITKTHAAGGMVHIWVWGDDSRRMTPNRIGGKNGPADRRLQRYIAARLGPLPGWTMGYGFDLWEWVRKDDLKRWHGYMHEHFGWPHLLGGRAHKNRLTQIYEGLDYSGYEQHRPDYRKYVETISKRPKKPSFSEDRFRVRQRGHGSKDYDMARTRRGLWHSTMAGGVANIWGRLDGRSSRRGSLPYSRPHWIKTWSVFFRDRFAKDMVRRNQLTDGVCLAGATRKQYVFYKEDADRIVLDLSKMAGPQRVVAVDALRPYKELDVGRLGPGKHTWAAPHRSDWAIAAGDFEDE
ncbi:MAG: DUF5060 domain-containing protein [Planctomycetota bacterium]